MKHKIIYPGKAKDLNELARCLLLAFVEHRDNVRYKLTEISEGNEVLGYELHHDPDGATVRQIYEIAF